jgi:hypothetical protein
MKTTLAHAAADRQAKKPRYDIHHTAPNECPFLEQEDLFSGELFPCLGPVAILACRFVSKRHLEWIRSIVKQPFLLSDVARDAVASPCSYAIVNWLMRAKPVPFLPTLPATSDPIIDTAFKGLDLYHLWRFIFSPPSAEFSPPLHVRVLWLIGAFSMLGIRRNKTIAGGLTEQRLRVIVVAAAKPADLSALAVAARACGTIAVLRPHVLAYHITARVLDNGVNFNVYILDFFYDDQTANNRWIVMFLINALVLRKVAAIRDLAFLLSIHTREVTEGFITVGQLMRLFLEASRVDDQWTDVTCVWAGFLFDGLLSPLAERDVTHCLQQAGTVFHEARWKEMASMIERLAPGVLRDDWLALAREGKKPSVSALMEAMLC